MIIAQLSDPHIIGDGHDYRAASLAQAVAHLLRQPARPDLVLLTGDCTDDGDARSYARLQELLQPLTMPVYLVPGNHDDRAQMLALWGPQGATPLPGYVQYVVEGWPLRLIALDTNIPGRGAGLLCPERLGWLERRLAEQPERPTLLFMHHPPFPTGLAVFDEIGLSGAEQLGGLVARHPNVELLVAGHVHATITRRFYGTLAMTCAATGQHMLHDHRQPERLSVVMQPPSCLIHIWRGQHGLLSYPSLVGADAPVVELHDGQRWLV